jgi:hypothetical protein
VEFKVPYVLAMREHAPKMFMELRRLGKLDQFVQEKSAEAHSLLRELLARRPRDSYGHHSPADEREAEEIVRAHLIEFPQEKKPDRLEPPDDLPHQGRMPVSRA